MPSEYEALVAALKLTDIPFAEYGWNKRPEGTYGVVSLDFEAGSQDGDGEKQDRAWEASVDVFIRLIRERDDVIEAVEEVLTQICGSAWWQNSHNFETNTGLFHIEWVCKVMDEAEDPEPEPTPTPEPEEEPEEGDG